MTLLSGKKILIRADSSINIGTGHIVRTHVLAQALRQAGASVTYACREGEGSLIPFLRDQGYDLQIMPAASMPFDPASYGSWLGAPPEEDISLCFGGARFDLAVIDHYGAGYEWQTLARRYVGRIMVVDDEGLAKFDCDLLLNQNYYPQGAALYDGKVAKGCRVLAGPVYALLREEFTAARAQSPVRERLRHLLVMMGGADPQQLSRKIAEALDTDLAVTIIMGAAYTAEGDLRVLCEAKGFSCLKGASNVAALMAQADFCIGAGGTTSWERCCMRLPSALFCAAENQRAIAANLGKAGAAIYLGDPASFDFSRLNALLADLRRYPEKLQAVSKAAGELTDGKGVQRVVREIAGLL